MPKLGRPSSQEKKSYFFAGEVQRKAPFGTNYTPTYVTKIVGSKYRKIEDSNSGTPRSLLAPLALLDDRQFSVNHRPVLPPICSERTRNYNLADFVSLLPAGSELPSRALMLRNLEQISLIDITKNEIHALPDFISNLKRIYLMLTKIDINLTGSCSFKEFVDSCHHNNVHLSWDLFRVISALFVASNRDDAGFVHYEKILSFLGAIYNSIDLEKKQDHGGHVDDSNGLGSSHDHYNLMDDPDFIGSVHDELGMRLIPIQRIRLLCQRTDSSHRGTLSARQLEDICVNEGLIFRKNTFDKILQRCKYMGGGQYKWQTFIEFMETVQPISTGLQIPNSKMPVDYIKHIPSPASSWPHAEPLDPHLDVRDSHLEPIQKLQPHTSRQDFSQQHSPRTEYLNEPTTNPNYWNANTNRHVETGTYQGEPWFNRFLRFVDSVYVKDVHSRGILPSKELFDLAEILNHQLSLNFTTTEIISALDGSTIDHDHINININSFLKRLSVLSKK